MANYIAHARSNYFSVKDPEAFKEWVDTIPDASAVYREEDDKYMILIDGGDGGGWPSARDVEELDENGEVVNFYYEDLDIPAELAPHLQKGEVAILKEVGHRKLCYFTGFAIAVAWTGDIEKVSIDDIYELAARSFVGCNEITDTSY